MSGSGRRVDFRVDEARYQWLATTAAEQGTSVAAIVRQMIDRFLDEPATVDDLRADRDETRGLQGAPT